VVTDLDDLPDGPFQYGSRTLDLLDDVPGHRLRNVVEQGTKKLFRSLAGQTPASLLSR